jgi:hypothetical protein
MKDVIRQGLGTGGGLFGTSGRARQTFVYSFFAIAVLVGTINAINVITLQDSEPDHNVLRPLILEGSSWVTLLLSVWVPWLAWRLAPPAIRPRWKLLLHGPAFGLFSFLHVGGFQILRAAIYRLAGAHYALGGFFPRLLFEMRKDILGYVVFIGLFTAVHHLLRQADGTPVRAPDPAVSTFDIRDGARLTRVRLEEILAVTSAGNYVEFLLADGRRLLMRSPLQAMEAELAPRGFLRTHRSWLVNARKVTALRPEGSGDYTVELGTQPVPLSRRFPDALAKLRSP